MHIPFGLEFVLVFAALAVIAFVGIALALILKVWRDPRSFLNRPPRGRLPKESQHV